MTKLLHVIASPRGEASSSLKIATAFLEAYCQARPDATVDTLNVWDGLPEFDGNKAAAKMTFFGVGKLEGELTTAWDTVVGITERFISADRYLFSVPMWNGGIPYKLKHYIDIITQPGLLFGFDPATGYSGLLHDKKAVAIYTSGVYAPGVPPAYGSDFHSTYLNDWLQSVGVTEIGNVRFQPSLLTADPAGGRNAAIAQARELATSF